MHDAMHGVSCRRGVIEDLVWKYFAIYGLGEFLDGWEMFVSGFNRGLCKRIVCSQVPSEESNPDNLFVSVVLTVEFVNVLNGVLQAIT